ncbi:MAG: SPFH domain-containing protein [Anaerolineae bacterium]|nr:SPFH domain-containing protein [Anaerolineae bacterium]
MSIYQVSQEFSDLRWGTMMPVMVKIGDNIVQLRARGTFSVIVSDPAVLESGAPAPDDLPFYLKNFAVSAITDLIGIQSRNLSSAGELTSQPRVYEAQFKTLLAERLQNAGVQLKDAVIEAIESL